MKLNIITNLQERDLSFINIHQTISQLRLALGTGYKIVTGEVTDDVPKLYYLKKTKDPNKDDWTIHALSTDIIRFFGVRILGKDYPGNPGNPNPPNKPEPLPIKPLKSKLSRDPLNIGGADLKIAGTEELIEFTGNIKWYRNYPTTEVLDPGNYVGVMITPEEGMIDNFPNVKIIIDGVEYGKELFTVQPGVSSPKALYYYPKVSRVTQAFRVVIEWMPSLREAFIITINPNSRLLTKGEIIKETYGYEPTSTVQLADKKLICNGNPTVMDCDGGYCTITKEENKKDIVPRIVFNSIIQGQENEQSYNNTWAQLFGIKALDLISGSKGVVDVGDERHLVTNITLSQVDNLILGNIGGGQTLNMYSSVMDSEVNKLRLSTGGLETQFDKYKDLIIDTYNTKFQQFGIQRSTVSTVDVLYFNVDRSYIVSTESIFDLVGTIKKGVVKFTKCIFSDEAIELNIFKSGNFKGDLEIRFINCKFSDRFRFNLGYSRFTETYGLNQGNLKVEFSRCSCIPKTYVHKGLEDVNIDLVGSKVHFKRYNTLSEEVSEYTINPNRHWKFRSGYAQDPDVIINKYGSLEWC